MGGWLQKFRNMLFAGDLVDVGFRISVLLKGLGGFFELLGSLLLFFLNPVRMNRIALFLTRHLFSTWPWQPVGTLLTQFGAHFSTGAQIFGILYLLSHGAVKCVLMVLLWKRKLWAYPLAIVSILLFMAYQVGRIAARPTFPMIFLTVFDAAMIALTAVEYRRVRRYVAAEKRRV